MSLEWFSRMENAVRVSLPDVCEGFEDFELLFDTDTTEQHPSFIFSVDLGEETYEFCVINFDTINQEFYSYHFDEVAELHAKVLFSNLDEMLSFIHAAFHEYLDEFDDEYEDLLEEDEDDVLDDDMFGDVIYEGDSVYEGDVFDEQDEDFEDEIEWISNDKYIHIEDNNPYQNVEHAISYRLGKLTDTGDGVLLRNTITRENGEETEEEVLLIFKEEEASYIIDLVSEYLSSMNTRK
ncbi:hypothetical protein IMZ08_18180 [Bacillus luteolus]|uniref:Uncharacterized protein n=1 Tax=Litchfieldia luteola TaxID=682179 RepID=A0ABR9QN89_9BACI|nr:hypothetical protein [Cytobacillus luteolus]MBE4909968.1 hypothetical protein [Cytobacillus luteolus]MBP1942475.1 hypothetical protein [Cytobacillus luteolus]